MKKMITALVIAMGMSASAYAIDPARCIDDAGLATSVMEMRQKGVEKDVVASVIYTETGLGIIDWAYDKAIVADHAKPLVVQKFSEAVYSTCMKYVLDSNKKSFAI